MELATTCPRCGLASHRGKGCPKRPRKSGKHAPREIVSFDCETTNAGIVLFLASGENRDSADWVYDAAGLDLTRILNWMIRAGKGKLCFGFFFDYDVNQVLRLLPPIHIEQLAACGRVTWRGYKIRHIPGKKFTVGREGEPSVTIWDCASWAQTSFVKVCDGWRLGTEPERELIRAMKARRGDFENATEQELIEYTTLECALLSEWVRRLLELHESCEISLKAYSGPGSTASALIAKSGWKPPEVPARIQEIAEASFFGGRSEISCVGPVEGPIYGYDINSAYPYAIAGLPEIRDRKWRRTRRFVPGAFGFYHVKWEQKKTDCWGLFPVRGAMLPSGRRSISLLYPTHGEGWFSHHEVAAALDLNPAAVEVVGGWVLDNIGKPFAWVEDMAAKRLEYKARGDERAFPLKVGLNSIYGKLAQHSGTHPLQCIVYAAAVTSQTRAALIRAAYPRQHDVILLATDGILSRVELPELPIGAALGTWERDEYTDAWMLQAGVYWAGEKKRTRGIDARTLELPAVDSLWKRRGSAAVVALPSRRVLSYRLCASQGKIEKTGTWYDSVRSVRFSPTPRRRSYRWRGDTLLTVPARVADYNEQVRMDSMMMQLSPDDDGGGNDFEALPDWALPE